MGRCVVKLGDDAYIEWSTVVDAPTSPVLDRCGMVDYLRDSPGLMETQMTIDEICDRIERADRQGTSMYNGISAQELLAFNRAGENEACLTPEEIIRQYSPKK